MWDWVLQHLPVSFRRRTDEPAEGGGEVALAGEADAQRDLDDGDVRLGQKLLRALDAALDEVVVRTHTHRLLEGAGEVEVTHTDCPGDRRKRDVLLPLQVVVHELDGLAQLAGGHPASAYVHVAEVAVAPDELDGEHRRQRVGVEAADDVRLRQLVQQRHPDVADVLVADAELRLDGHLAAVEVVGFGGRAQVGRSQVQVQRVARLVFTPAPVRGRAGRDDRNVAGADVLVESALADARAHV